MFFRMRGDYGRISPVIGMGLKLLRLIIILCVNFLDLLAPVLIKSDRACPVPYLIFDPPPMNGISYTIARGAYIYIGQLSWGDDIFSDIQKLLKFFLV